MGATDLDREHGVRHLLRVSDEATSDVVPGTAGTVHCEWSGWRV